MSALFNTITDLIEDNNATFSGSRAIATTLDCELLHDTFNAPTSKGECTLVSGDERVRVQYSLVYSSYVFDNVYDLN